MVMTSKMKGSLPCKCERGERQRIEDDWARQMGRKPKTVNHEARCPIVVKHRLTELDRKIEGMANALTLPDPIFEAMEQAKMLDLQAERARLVKALAPYVTTAVASDTAAPTAD